MADETTTEEEKQVGILLNQWTIFDGRWTYAYAIGVGVVLVGASFLPINLIVVQGILIGCGIIGGQSFSRSMAQRFVRRLSKEEREGIHNALKPMASSSRLVSRFHPFRELYKACEVNAQKELLRPSTEPHDETLLRAATSTGITPQEQLLRPSSTEE